MFTFSTKRNNKMNHTRVKLRDFFFSLLSGNKLTINLVIIIQKYTTTNG